MLEAQAHVLQARDDERVWVQIAQDAYQKSTTYVDNNYRKQWENNYRHFMSRHHAGSKYYKASYLYRSRIFRPKTRSAIRNNEAAAVAAFFSNQDVVSIQSQNTNDPMQRASADIVEALLQYRLTKTIPWFLICIGAYQDSMVPGVVCSYQSWEYEEAERVDRVALVDADRNPVLDGDGKPQYTTIKEKKVIKDQPAIRLIPVENLRIDPAADWTDPINSSPYVIELMPMYIMDVKFRMNASDPKTGQPKWRELPDEVLKTARSQRFDITRQAREGQRTDRMEPQASSKELALYDIVWVHRNIIKIKHQDWVYYTLGTEHLLSDPKPLEQVYFHGERPYVMGISVIEAHKIYPSGLGQLGEGIQKEINENANQRLDNVKLVLNKRYFVKRGSQVDLKSLVRNAAGSITMVNDINGDVKEMEFNDVTRSSYQEQDRLNVDFDEVVGNFSVSTIQTNRRLNETVGGMNLLKGNTNALTEYALRTFSETWVEPVMRQLVKLEQKYETDTTILAIAAEKANIFQKYGIDEVTDELLNQELTTTVNVGMGATDPLMRLRNFTFGLRIILEVVTKTPPGSLNVMEVAKEVFGYLGFKDGERFFVEQMGDDPEKMQMGMIIQQLQLAIQRLQEQLDSKMVDNETKLIAAKMKEQGEDRRKLADIRAKLEMKAMDLLNPVVGETVPANAH